jgi:hypothetical protein
MTGGWVGPIYGMDSLEKIKSVECSQQKERYISKDVEARGIGPAAGNNTAFAW